MPVKGARRKHQRHTKRGEFALALALENSWDQIEKTVTAGEKLTDVVPLSRRDRRVLAALERKAAKP